MAVITNTFVSGSAVGNREDLSNVVSRITPEDTPIYSLAGKEKAANTFSEWEIDSLAAPADNKVLEGDQYSYAAISPPTRVGNYQQILRKEAIVSKTQEAITNVGTVERLKEQVLKRGIELRKDVEFAIVQNNTAVKTGTREMSSLPAWLETNALRGSSGADGGWDSSNKYAAAETTGTLRDFTKSQMDSCMQSIYEEGGTPKFMVCSPGVKGTFVGFMSDTNVAAFRYNTDGGKNTIVGTADMYEGPFGKVSVIPNRVMTPNALKRRVFFIDPMYIKMCSLRRMNTVTPAETSDAVKRVIIMETTLKVTNEAACGVVADVNG